jgi:hypothetical protein
MPELNQPEFDLECFPLDNPIFGFFPVNEANRRQKMEQENIEFHLSLPFNDESFLRFDSNVDKDFSHCRLDDEMFEHEYPFRTEERFVEINDYQSKGIGEKRDSNLG